MQFRRLVPIGLALLVFTGCQSYFPYGYGNNGAYPAMSGSYPPPGSSVPSQNSSPSNSQPGSGKYPTPVDGQKNSPSGQNGVQSQSTKGQVPKYGDPAGPPGTLGAPADEEEDSINRGSSSRENSARHADESEDESEVSLSSLDEGKFLSPTQYRAASASSDDPDMRRVASRPRPSPYMKDPNGYKWLRGVVSRDSRSNSWRITYSRDPLDNDPYGGSLALVDSSVLDTLMEDDVVYVEGDVDRSVLDRYKKPSYRATRVLPLIPKDR